MLNRVLKLRVELRPVVALVEVGYDDCPLIFLGLGLDLDTIAQKVDGDRVLQRFLSLRLRDLSSLVILVEYGLAPQLSELLVEGGSLLGHGLVAVTLIVNRVNW